MKNYLPWGGILVLLTGLIFWTGSEPQAFAETPQFIQGTNPKYEVGDWISYTDTQYMNSIAIGNRYVYFATTGGIARYDFYGNRWARPFTLSDGLPDNDILTVAFDFESGSVYCAGALALSVRDPASKRWTNYSYREIGVGRQRVHSIGFDNEYVYLVTTGNAAYRGRRNSTRFESIALNRLMHASADSIAWFGRLGYKRLSLPNFLMNSSLLFFPDDARPYFQDVNDRDFEVKYYVEDPWQFLWLGTWGLGGAKANMRTNFLEMIPFGLIEKDVNAIATNGDEMWLGGINYGAPIHGITRWNRKTGDWVYYEARYIMGLRSDDVTSIAPDGRYVWFGTLDGLSLLDRQKNDWVSFTILNGLADNHVYDVVVDSDFIWVATEEGLDRVDKALAARDTLSVKHITRPRDKVPVYDIEMDSNLVWAATGYGVYVYNRTNQKGGYYSGANGPGTASVFGVSVSGNEVWFATRYGVEAYNKSEKKWMGPPARHLVPDLKAFAIRATPKAVWLGTTNGVYKYDRRRDFWRKFSQIDGLLDPRVQDILPDGNYIWFGTREGLTRFYWNAPYRID
ncbi:two component regulator propeller [bacterium BMS3Abin05]|nr:two component regulator propeller [bacterium BMS3Abin05]GBE28538.1 two component regulator propeller [bacterium BMS3Bbin03]HDZ12169.1 hypothetical protein [Bacteroidota bacterium]